MPTSNVFRATSFSIFFAAAILLDGCGGSEETISDGSPCYYYYVISRSGLPEFNSSLFFTPDSGGQRLDVYVSLKQSRLKFEKINDSYRAKFLATFKLSRENTSPVVQEIERNVRRSTYPTVSDSSYDAFMVSFRVSAGEYSLEISVSDETSGQKATRVYTKEIPEVSDRPLQMSDILFLLKSDTAGQGRRITPFILPNAGQLTDTLKFFTVISARETSRDSIFFNVYRLENRERLPSVYGRGILAGTGLSYDPCSVKPDSILVYSYGLRAGLGNGFSYVFGGIPKPLSGDYILEVIAKDKSHNVASAFLPFHIRGASFPDVTDDNLDMVNSLAYIASKGELEKIVAVRTDSAVKSNLLKFWSEYGGYLKMAEYYRRVSQANRLFTGCIDGWKTPMGMMYVVCGPPDYVECRGSYAERWLYILSSNDERALVDFRLSRDTKNMADRYYGIENVYSNVDFWNYYVNRWRSPY